MAEVLDSYTGEPYVEDYVSKIEGIRRGRESFWRRQHMLEASEQYWVSPVALAQDPAALDSPSGAVPDSHLRDLPPQGWLLRRRNSPEDLFPLMSSESKAVAAMDWCVRNDASVQIVVHWLLKGNVTPYLCLLQDLVEVTKDV